MIVYSLLKMVVFAMFVAVLGGEHEKSELDLVPVERTPFRVTLELSGVFEESDPWIFFLNPQVFRGDLIVVDAIAPGPVVKGQVLMRFDTREIDEQILREELDLASHRARVAQQSSEFAFAERVSEMDLLGLELGLEDAERMLVQATKIDMPSRLMSSEYQVDGWEEDREAQESQFNRLVQMYEEDGVLETAEKMDIESTKRRLAQSALSGPNVMAHHQILKDITLPKQLVHLELQRRRAEHAYGLKRLTWTVQVAEKRNDLEKQEWSLEEKENDLIRLRRDRELFTVKSPRDGFAIAGSYRRSWTRVEGHGPRIGERVSANQEIFTVVSSAPKGIRASVSESDLLNICKGQDAAVIPTAISSVTLPAEVTRVLPYSSNGNYEVSLLAKTRHERLFPGNTCRVKVTIYENPDALVIPSRCIRCENSSSQVDVWEMGKIVSREVVVGRNCDGRSEILSGLSLGEEVLRTH